MILRLKGFLRIWIYFSFRFCILIFCLFPWFLQSDELIIVSPHWDGIQKEFSRAFKVHYQENWGKEVTIRWRDLGGTSQIEKALQALYEKNSQTSGMDIFWGGGMDPYENQKNKKRLESYFPSQEILGLFPSFFLGMPLQDAEGFYYATALSSFGIFENRLLRKIQNLPEVRVWEDLARPEFQGWIALVDPRKSGSAHLIYEIILQAYGWEKGSRILMALCANARTFSQNSSAAVKEVSMGNVSHALSIDMNAYALKSVLGEDRVRWIFPKGQSVMVPDGIGILKGAPNREVAKRFVDFVLSEKGQNLWIKPVGSPEGAQKYAIQRDSVLMLGTDSGKESFSNEGFQYDSKKAASRWMALNEWMGRVWIDLHDELQQQWILILKRPVDEREKLKELFLSPLISEEELQRFEAIWKQDRIQAEKEALQWSQKALERYRKDHFRD